MVVQSSCGIFVSFFKYKQSVDKCKHKIQSLHSWFQTFIYLWHMFPTFRHPLLRKSFCFIRLTQSHGWHYFLLVSLSEKWPSIRVFPVAPSGGPSLILPKWVCAAEEGIVLSVLSLKLGIQSHYLASQRRMFFPDQKWTLQQGIWLAVCVSVVTTFLKKSNSTMTVISKIPLDNTLKSCVRNNKNQAHCKSLLF